MMETKSAQHSAAATNEEPTATKLSLIIHADLRYDKQSSTCAQNWQLATLTSCTQINEYLEKSQQRNR